MNRLSLADYFTASAPILGSITAEAFNQGAQAFGALLGAAYLVWKWRREARAGVTPPASRQPGTSR